MPPPPRACEKRERERSQFNRFAGFASAEFFKLFKPHNSLRCQTASQSGPEEHFMKISGGFRIEISIQQPRQIPRSSFLLVSIWMLETEERKEEDDDCVTRRRALLFDSVSSYFVLSTLMLFKKGMKTTERKELRKEDEDGEIWRCHMKMLHGEKPFLPISLICLRRGTEHRQQPKTHYQMAVFKERGIQIRWWWYEFALFSLSFSFLGFRACLPTACILMPFAVVSGDDEPFFSPLPCFLNKERSYIMAVNPIGNYIWETRELSSLNESYLRTRESYLKTIKES